MNVRAGSDVDRRDADVLAVFPDAVPPRMRAQRDLVSERNRLARSRERRTPALSHVDRLAAREVAQRDRDVVVGMDRQRVPAAPCLAARSARSLIASRSRTSHARRFLAQLEQRADVVVVQPPREPSLEARQCRVTDRRRDAEASTICNASRQSLCASFIMKPGVKSPASGRFGIAIASWLFHAIVVLSTLSIVSSVRPALAPATSASIDASRHRVASRLLMSFIVCPAPSSPQWKKSVPMQSSTGRQRATHLGRAADHQRQRARHRGSAVLPTGLSIIAAPLAAIAAPTLRVVAGSMVLMST